MQLQLGRSAEAFESLRPAIAAGEDREAYWLLSRACLQSGQKARGEEALAKAGNYRQQSPMEFEPSPYVGEAKCEECHRPIFQATLSSRHARTLIRGRDSLKIPLPERPLKDLDNPHVFHEFHRDEGRVKVLTRVDSTVFHAVVDYALGASDRYTSLVGRDDQGQVRTLRLSYFQNARESGWCRSKFQFPSPAHEHDYLGVVPVSIDEANECLTCHTTTARSVREGSGPESTDRGIGCERCHGPGGLHIAAINSRFSDPMIASPAKSAPGQINQLCATCHSQHFIAMPESFTDPAWAAVPQLFAFLEPLLNRERGRPELRDLPRPPPGCGNLAKPLRSEMFNLSCARFFARRNRFLGGQCLGVSVVLSGQPSARLCAMPHAEGPV